MITATTDEKIRAAEQFVQDHFDDALVDFEDVDIHDLVELYEIKEVYDEGRTLLLIGTRT